MNQIIKYNGKEFSVKKRGGLLTLNLSKKGIKDISEIENLEYMKDLQVLNLNDNEITEIKGLESLMQLKFLDLSHNKITKIEGLEKLINLEKLNLEYNEIETIQGLDNLEKLTMLSFDGNKISRVESFKNKDHLTHLILGSSNVLHHKVERIFDVVNSKTLIEFSQMSQAEKEDRDKAAWEEIFRQERLKEQKAKKMIAPKIKKKKRISPSTGILTQFLAECIIIIVFLIIFLVLIIQSMKS